MTARSMPNGTGLEIIDPQFRMLGLCALKAAFEMPLSLREILLFGTSSYCILLQKLLTSALGGVSMVQTRFTDGPMTGQNFACLTSEAYFMLGSHREDDLQNFAVHTIKPTDVVYDIGAHVGYTALLFSALVGSRGHVFCFEPSPKNYARLCANLDANRKSNVTAINAAVSDRESMALLEEHGTTSTLISGSEKHSAPIANVQTLRLDDFIYRDGNRPMTFVKLDVEGHGGAVLEGMKCALESQHPTIVCEFHNRDEEERATRVLAACRYRLSSLGKRKYPFKVVAS